MIGKFTKEELQGVLVGKAVRITHIDDDSNQRDKDGTCVAVHITGPGFDIELNDGSRHGIIPDTLSETVMEGPFGKTVGRRRFEIAPG